MEVLVDAMISDPRHPFWKPEPSFIGILRLDGKTTCIIWYSKFQIENKSSSHFQKLNYPIKIPSSP